MESINTRLANEEITLYPHKALKYQTDLLIADLHLGKVNHFRKAGMPVPELANRENTERLIDLIQLSKPHRVILMGDLFHSHYNSEWEVFLQVVKHFNSIEFHLVEGNHDILSKYQYEKAPLFMHENMELGPFLLTHIPLEEEQLNDTTYNLSGHLHPAVVLSGKGRQSVLLPCFYFGKKQGFLPAFGNFTGNKKMKPLKDDRIFVVVNEQVIQKN